MKRRAILLFGILLILFSSFVSAALIDDIGAYFKMDETGNTVIDETGTLNGTQSTAASTTGIINNARNVSNDNNKAISFASGTTWKYTDLWSMSVWVNADNDFQDAIYSFNNGGAQHSWATMDQSSNRVGFTIYDGSGTCVVAEDVQITSGTWHHYVFTFSNADDRIRLYKDGDLENEVACTRTPSSGSSTLAFGRHVDTSHALDGAIDEVGIWNAELTSTDVTDLYNSGAGFEYPFSTNTGPDTPTPALQSLDNTNRTTVDLNCSAIITDPDANKMNVSVQWFRNSTLYSSYSLNNNYNNGTSVSHILGSGNLSINDSWICSMRATDGSATSDWGNSTELSIVYDAYWTWTNITLSTNSGVRGEQFTVQVGVTCSSGTADCDGNAGTIHLDPKIFDNRIVTSDPWMQEDYWYVELL